jgi:hypothetical protein
VVLAVDANGPPDRGLAALADGLHYARDSVRRAPVRSQRRHARVGDDCGDPATLSALDVLTETHGAGSRLWGGVGCISFRGASWGLV